MNLGETICRLRAQRGMSQGDLADALEVSRQSVSKWETNSSVPELDKLVRLSELFEVTLDELVRGKEAQPVAEAPPPQIIVQQVSPPPGRTAGMVLLCSAAVVFLVCTLLGGLLEGLVLALPFLICGLICLFCRRRRGLWCGWAVFAMVDIYLRLATGINWGAVWLTVRFWPEMTVRIIVAWCQLLVLLLMLGLTLFSFRGTEVSLAGRRKWLLLGGWVLLFALHLPLYWVGAHMLRVASILTDWVRMPLFVFLLVVTVRGLRTWKKERGAGV